MNELKIVRREEMKVVGKCLHTSFLKGQSKKDIPDFFHNILEQKKLEGIPGRKNNNQLCIFRFKRDTPEFDYIMGTEVISSDNIPENMEFVYFPEIEYVSLKIIKRGHEDVGRAFKHIIEGWLPKSEYEMANIPGFIYYYQEFFSVFYKDGYAGNPSATVYVPIISKNK